MALKKAPSSDRHPAERADRVRESLEQNPAQDPSPAGPESGGVAVRVEAPSEAEQALGGNVFDMVSRVAPATRVIPSPAPAVTSPVPARPDRRRSARPEPPADEAGQGPLAGVRRVEVTKRGKRDYNYSWPKEDLALMRAEWEQSRAVYRRYWAERDSGGTYRLTQSAFWGHALLEALKDLDPWLPTVRNDARKTPLAGGREQVGLVWPVAVENAVVDLWETIDKSRFPDGFSLTKQHLAAAAILHGLKTVDEWVLTCHNDDRYNVPVEADGRLRENKAVPVGESGIDGRCDD